jgi:hypothetical protein
VRTIIAFAGGAILAAGVAIVALKKDPAVTETPVTQAVVTPVPTPAPLPPELPAAQETPVSRPAPSAQTSRPVRAVRTQNQIPNNGFVPPQLIQEGQPVAQAQPASQEPVAAPQAEVVATPPAPAPVAVPEPPKPAPPPEPNQVTIAAGTTVAIRLLETLSSDVVQPGQAFHATIDQPLVVDGFVIAERGARVEGRVTESQQAGRVKGISQLSLELTRITTADGQRIAISTQVWEKEGEQSRKSDATKGAAGAGIGAALGAIFGGGKGAAIGAASGGAAGGGVVLATRGKPVSLPSETRLSFRLRTPVTITEKR